MFEFEILYMLDFEVDVDDEIDKGDEFEAELVDDSWFELTVNTNWVQTSLVVLLPPVHAYPSSTVQILDQPSPSLAFLSSHCSPESLTPFPHGEVGMVQPEFDWMEPAGHVIVTLNGEFEM